MWGPVGLQSNQITASAATAFSVHLLGCHLLLLGDIPVACPRASTILSPNLISALHFLPIFWSARSWFHDYVSSRHSMSQSPQRVLDVLQPALPSAYTTFEQCWPFDLWPQNFTASYMYHIENTSNRQAHSEINTSSGRKVNGPRRAGLCTGLL